jgi:hypothetical protein
MTMPGSDPTQANQLVGPTLIEIVMPRLLRLLKRGQLFIVVGLKGEPLAPRGKSVSIRLISMGRDSPA